jgi:hypothetical protein
LTALHREYAHYLSIESPNAMETTMTLESARAILNIRPKEQSVFHGHSDTERVAFEQRLARTRHQTFCRTVLSASVGVPR